MVHATLLLNDTFDLPYLEGMKIYGIFADLTGQHQVGIVGQNTGNHVFPDPPETVGFYCGRNFS